MHRLLLPAKESFKGRSGQYFLGNNPLRRTQPFGCLELFSFKIPNLPHRVISVFWTFTQISSPTEEFIADNPKKLEQTLSTSQHMKCGNYLFRLVGLGTGVICQVLIHPVPSILGHRVKDISEYPEIFLSSTFTAVCTLVDLSC